MLSRLFSQQRRKRPARFQQMAFSQEGEDLVLARHFESHAPRSRFYVDVGAHHPSRFSNTYRFYLQGWRGINIEPNPDVAPLFRAERPEDINLTLGIAQASGRMEYLRFNEPALNTFDPAHAASIRNPAYHVVDQIPVAVERLDTLLARHVPPNTHIDFMSVDVEGRDLDVLMSNDWERWQPSVLVVEDQAFNLDAPATSAIHRLLAEKGYRLFAKTGYSILYASRKEEGPAMAGPSLGSLRETR